MNRILLPVFLLLLLVGCSMQNHKADNSLVFSYNESKGISSLDPAFARSLPLIWPVHQLFNGLVQLSDSLTVEPSIAHSWFVSDNGLAYTFNLRTDVWFHESPIFASGNSRRVVADDFVYSFSRILNPLVASPGAWVFSVLDTNYPGSSNGVKAVNDSTLTIYLSQPFPAFLGLLSMPYASVVPHEVVEYFGKDFRAHPIGTGPFYLKYWKEGEKLVFRKNMKYFEVDDTGNRLPYFEAINISFITDKQSEFLEFLMGNIDFISGIQSTYKDELLTRSGGLNPSYAHKVKLITGPYLNTEYLGVLVDTTLDIVKHSPLRLPEVRKAIAFGFDREKMIAHLRNNMGYAAHSGFVPSGMPGASKTLKGFNYNPEYSRHLLAKAGYPNGEGLQPITLCTTADYLDISEYIQHQLAQVGIPIEVEVFPGAAFREMMANGKMILFRGSWVADYADPENYLSLFLSKNFSPHGPNYTHFSNSTFDSLYAQALQEPCFNFRTKLYGAMDSLVISHASVIPLFYDKVVRFVNPSIEGMKSNPMNLLTLKKVYKKHVYEDNSR